MRQLTVHLGQRSYPIYIGAGLLANSQLLCQHILGKQVLIVSNPTIAPHYLQKVQRACQHLQCDHILLPDGEQYKTLTIFNTIIDRLLEKSHSRDTTIIALGGGVIGDMAGFAAACYQRGANLIQIPTTLLAQVDASVGGKTGVNHPSGKNMIGAFYQPLAVIVDTDTLSTLADREYYAGLAEVIKYGMLADLDFLHWLQNHMDELLAKQADALQYAIERCCALKADIVAADERESGQRALLNLGHTFAHAIESASNYTEFLHGEAVAIGLGIAADLSYQLGNITDDDLTAVKQLLKAAKLPQRLPATITTAQMLTIMLRDKKVSHGKQRFVLLKRLGQAFVTIEVSQELIEQSLARARNIDEG